MTALSATMQDALAKGREHGGRLVRLPGGFWTYPDCPARDSHGYSVPEWSISAHTIKALLARGLVEAETYARNGFLVAVKVMP